MKKFKISFVVLIIISAAYYLFAPHILERFLVVNSPVTHPDALVVMAGSKDHRLPIVADLYHQGVAPQILLTNDGNRGAWSDKYQRNLYMVEWAREDLIDLGVHEDDLVLLEFKTSGSIYDALNTYNYLLNQDRIRRFLVVTSHYHTRRSFWSFNRVFFDLEFDIGVYPVPKDPDYTGRYLKSYTIELLKYFYYLLRYRNF